MLLQDLKLRNEDEHFANTHSATPITTLPMLPWHPLIWRGQKLEPIIAVRIIIGSHSGYPKKDQHVDPASFLIKPEWQRPTGLAAEGRRLLDGTAAVLRAVASVDCVFRKASRGLGGFEVCRLGLCGLQGLKWQD